MRISFYVLTALALVGVYISDLLVVAHVDALFGSGADSGICGGEGFSCAEAARSDYARLFGLPIAALGQAYYLIVIVLAGLQRFKPDTVKGIPDVLVASAGLGVAYSIFLAIVSVTSVGKFCPLCMGLYAVNLGLFIAALVGHPQRAGFFGRIFKLPTQSGFWVSAVLLAAATLGTQGVYAHRAEAAQADALKRAATQPKPQQYDVDTTGAPGKGPENAPVVIVEWSDFECPHCRKLSEMLSAAAKARPDLVRYYFRHNPMDQACNPNITRPFHRHACDAAVASICAQRQGRFWELHDLIFANARKLSRDELDGYAKQVGLDMELFTTCLDDPSVIEQIKDDIRAGAELGVRGTPTWFLNGWNRVGAPRGGLDQLIGLIEKAAQDAKK